MQAGLRDGARTAFEVVPALIGDAQLPLGWALPETLAYLRHLEVLGEVERSEDGGAERWALT